MAVDYGKETVRNQKMTTGFHGFDHFFQNQQRIGHVLKNIRTDQHTLYFLAKDPTK